MTSESAALTGGAVARPGPTFEGRAAVTLRAVALFAGFVGIAMLGGGIRPPEPALIVLPAVFALIVLSWAAAVWIDRREPWAVQAAKPLLGALVAFGVIDILLSLQHSTIQIPLGAVLAVWAFRAPATPVAPPAWPARAKALVAAFVALHAVITLGPSVLGSGGPFAVGRDDIHVSLALDCGDPAAGVPDAIPVTFTWNWLRTEPFPSTSDNVAIAWDPGSPDLFYFDNVTSSDNEVIWSGGSGGESQALADRLVMNFGAGVTFAVDQSAQGYQLGSASVTLRRQPDAGPHGRISIAATYAHAGWEARTTHDCEW
ncbi:MAG: hypothetical protein ACJ77B_07285 [Chloroflexota bacterium]